jgi:hypothetical protein
MKDQNDLLVYSKEQQNEQVFRGKTQKAKMKGWLKGIIATAAWIILVIVVLIVDSQIRTLTPEQEATVSEAYGKILIYGIGIIWVFVALYSLKGGLKKNK